MGRSGGTEELPVSDNSFSMHRDLKPPVKIAHPFFLSALREGDFVWCGLKMSMM
jgi:hypothetical protein